MSDLQKMYDEGKNITKILKSSGYNSEKSIEIAYDLQSGSYIEQAKRNKKQINAWAKEIAKIIQPYIDNNQMILDCGTGEATTFIHFLNYLSIPPKKALAFDLSLSRVRLGEHYAQKNTRYNEKLVFFCASMEDIPLPKSSIDLVLTFHALEPNHGREKILIKELFRVSKSYVMLFEPCYEYNSDEGKKRMQQLGYIRNIDKTISSLRGVIEKKIPMKNISNPLNPTYCWIIKVPKELSISKIVKETDGSYTSFECPISKQKLQYKNGYLWSKEGMYAYPSIDGIPFLKKENAIVYSKADTILS
jgi:ubiquinone/menaquinone biosynthesis C-methylase UbiE/uncharacterized protein YbaR (Trm112 family)